MFSRKGFSLVELLVAIALVGVVALAVASVEFTSRNFFDAASKESWIQNEAKIAMEHLVQNIQPGIGDMTNPETADGTSPPVDSSRGFYILDAEGDLATSGSKIQIKIDDNGDGQFKISDDKIIQYELTSNTIEFDPDTGVSGDEENLAEDIVTSTIFTLYNGIPNQVNLTITVRRDPTEAAGLDNPETTLTSSIVLRAMSCE